MKWVIKNKKDIKINEMQKQIKNYEKILKDLEYHATRVGNRKCDETTSDFVRGMKQEALYFAYQIHEFKKYI